MMLMFLTGCNRQVIDTTFSYDNAILALPDGSVVSGKIESWKDYDDGDQIQVKIDGTTYLVHSVNAARSRKLCHHDCVGDGCSGFHSFPVFLQIDGYGTWCFLS